MHIKCFMSYKRGSTNSKITFLSSTKHCQISIYVWKALFKDGIFSIKAWKERRRTLSRKYVANISRENDWKNFSVIDYFNLKKSYYILLSAIYFIQLIINCSSASIGGLKLFRASFLCDQSGCLIIIHTHIIRTAIDDTNIPLYLKQEGTRLPAPGLIPRCALLSTKYFLPLRGSESIICTAKFSSFLHIL